VKPCPITSIEIDIGHLDWIQTWIFLSSCWKFDTPVAQPSGTQICHVLPGSAVLNSSAVANFTHRWRSFQGLRYAMYCQVRQS
jgi:hypothetical protein